MTSRCDPIHAPFYCLRVWFLGNGVDSINPLIHFLAGKRTYLTGTFQSHPQREFLKICPSLKKKNISQKCGATTTFAERRRLRRRRRRRRGHRCCRISRQMFHFSAPSRCVSPGTARRSSAPTRTVAGNRTHFRTNATLKWPKNSSPIVFPIKNFVRSVEEHCSVFIQYFAENISLPNFSFWQKSESNLLPSLLLLLLERV